MIELNDDFVQFGTDPTHEYTFYEISSYQSYDYPNYFLPTRNLLKVSFSLDDK